MENQFGYVLEITNYHKFPSDEHLEAAKEMGVGYVCEEKVFDAIGYVGSIESILLRGKSIQRDCRIWKTEKELIPNKGLIFESDEQYPTVLMPIENEFEIYNSLSIYSSQFQYPTKLQFQTIKSGDLESSIKKYNAIDSSNPAISKMINKTEQTDPEFLDEIETKGGIIKPRIKKVEFDFVKLLRIPNTHISIAYNVRNGILDYIVDEGKFPKALRVMREKYDYAIGN